LILSPFIPSTMHHPVLPPFPTRRSSDLGNIPTAHPAGIDNEFQALYQEQARLVEAILKEGARKKAIRSLRTEQTAFAISDIIRGVGTHRILGWSKSKISQDVDFIFDLVWKGIAAQ